MGQTAAQSVEFVTNDPRDPTRPDLPHHHVQFWPQTGRAGDTVNVEFCILQPRWPQYRRSSSPWESTRYSVVETRPQTAVQASIGGLPRPGPERPEYSSFGQGRGKRLHRLHCRRCLVTLRYSKSVIQWLTRPFRPVGANPRLWARTLVTAPRHLLKGYSLESRRQRPGWANSSSRSGTFRTWSMASSLGLFIAAARR